MAKRMQTDFSGGELSERILGRPELEVYRKGLRTCENFLPWPQGPIQARPGTKDVAAVKTVSARTRLIPFRNGTSASYILEFGNLYFRVYYNNAGTYQRLGTVEVTTPYTTAQLQDIQFFQSNDTMYLMHKSHPTKKLIKVSDSLWAISSLNYVPPATKEIWEVSSATLTFSAKTGTGITATASAATFIGLSDIGKIIRAGTGRAVIVGFTSTTVVTVDVLHDFDKTTAYAAGAWWIKGSPLGQLTPSATGPVNDDITLVGTREVFRTGGDSLPTDVGKYIYINDGIVQFKSQTLGQRTLFDISTADYLGKFKSVSAENDGALGLYFSPDGLRMYVSAYVSFQGVYQYDLSIPWDVSTATYTNQSLNTASEDAFPHGIYISDDGTYLFMIGAATDDVFKYVLSDPWNLSTAAYSTDSYAVTEDTGMADLSFNNDGTKMYVVGVGDTVYQYSLSPAWDITSASYDSKSKDLSSEETVVTGICFSANGTKMYAIGGFTDTVYQYTLSTAFDVSTASYDSKSLNTASFDDTPQGVFISEDGDYIYTIGNSNDKVTQFSMATSVTATCKVIRTLSSTSASYAWTLEGPIWNATDGYPQTGCFIQDRFALGGSTGYPQTFALSMVGDYENFEKGSNAADAIVATLNAQQVNEIKWMLARQELVLGTDEGEWVSNSGLITPTTINANMQTSHGSKNLRPVIVDGSILFFQRLGRKLRELTYDFNVSGYTAPDLTAIAEHITDGGIEEVSYQQSPLSIVWMVRSDGQIVGFTYDKANRMMAWHRHIIGGAFSSGDAVVESVACIPHPSGDYDELWMIVKRTINSAVSRRIEVLTKIVTSTTLTDYTQLDSSKVFGPVAATSTITGLSAWEGESLTVVNGTTGAEIGDYTVSGGEIDLGTTTVTKAITGYALLPKAKPVKVAPIAKQTINEVFVDLMNTRGGQIGSDLTAMDDMNYGTDDAGTVFTGVKKQNVKSKIDREGTLFITQPDPYPMTIRSITPDIEGSDA